MMKKGTYICAFLLLASCELFAQTQKVTFNGAARSEIFGSKLESVDVDTITAPKRSGGYALLDLGVNIQVNEKTEVQGMFRIRNELGGFWGANTAFTVRQLFLKGVIANSIRYQVGDIDQRMTPYTLYNNEQDMAFNSSALFMNQQAQVNYDQFYTEDNTWRQQGAAVDFGLEFKKIIKELRFYGLISRAGVTNFTNATDRLLGGANVGVFTNSDTYIGFNHANMFDLLGTADDSSGFRNTVNTISVAQDFVSGEHEFGLRAELGQSRSYMKNDSTFPEREDQFWDVALFTRFENRGKWEARIGLRNVGPDFRSAGAQTKRIDYRARPALYQNYTNDQVFRVFDMVDLLRDVTLYNSQLQTGLMAYNPSYGNVQPYGQATPNRAGVYALVDYEDSKERWELQLKSFNGRQIRGEGTTELKNFQRVEMQAIAKIDRFLDMKRDIRLTIGAVNESTTRDGLEEYEKVDLSTIMIDLGLEVEVASGLDIIAAYRQLNSDGKENNVLRDASGDIIDFPEYRTELSQTVFGAGLRYRFSENSNISGQQMFSNSSDELNPALEYDMNMFVLLFTTKF